MSGSTGCSGPRCGTSSRRSSAAAQAQGRTSYDLLSARAEEILADPESREKVATYDHVIVDKGQDLHAGHWRILRGLVAPGPNDLFLCEDGHQRIYGDRLVLSRWASRPGAAPAGSPSTTAPPGRTSPSRWV